MRRTAVASQGVAFPEMLYPDFLARVVGLAKQISIADTQYYEVSSWANHIAEPIRVYRASPWTGLRYGASPAGSFLGIVMLAATVVGIARLIVGIRVGIRAGIRAGATNGWFVGLWGVLTVLVVLATIRLTWQRYYMPVYPVQILLAGMGAAWIAERCKGFIANRRRAEP